MRGLLWLHGMEQGPDLETNLKHGLMPGKAWVWKNTYLHWEVKSSVVTLQWGPV